MAAEPCSLKALRSFLASSGLLGLLASSASRCITATFLLHFTISRRRNQAAPSTLCLEITSAKWSGSSLTSSTCHPTEQGVSPGYSKLLPWSALWSLTAPGRDDQTLYLDFWARFRSFTITPNKKYDFGNFDVTAGTWRKSFQLGKTKQHLWAIFLSL